MTISIREEYQKRYDEILTHIAPRLESHIYKLMEGVSRIDRISARAKDPDRFFMKATKLDENDNIKYDDPINQIQDQLGARIIVFYKQDLEHIKSEILKYMTAIEVQIKEPSTDSEFGYFGEHYILRVPPDAIPDGLEEESPEFFELQVKTLFQHAWSEAHHDLGYKSIRDLTPIEKRKVAFTAAQAWGADEIFSELANGLVFCG